MSVRILVGGALDRLADLPDSSVHCCITSPPYWGLRAYQGDPGMIGLEPTFDEHLENLVAVFREVRRVLRPDGTLWLNYGDAYSTGTTAGRQPTQTADVRGWQRPAAVGPRANDPGLKTKDLMMMPARVALALQADGWWLRSEIIWHKPNPMPESCTDRPTSAHEKVFLLTKSGNTLFWTHPLMGGVRKMPEPDHYWRHKDTKEERDACPDGWAKNTKAFPWTRLNRWQGHDYFYDAEAVRTPIAVAGVGCEFKPRASERKDSRGRSGSRPDDSNGANLRNVWTIATHAYSEAHFATFPPALVEPCIKAGTSAKGVCGECGAPWVRVVEKEFVPQPDVSREKGVKGAFEQKPMGPDSGWDGVPRGTNRATTTGWSPSCECKGTNVDGTHVPPRAIPATVLDIFAGSGTVGLVADRLQRDAILIEISEEYAAMARKRIDDEAGKLFVGVDEPHPSQRGLL